MKNIYILIFLFILLATPGFSQNWIIYDASSAPADNVDPVWNASNGSEGTWTVMADPDVAGNSFVMHESLGAGSGMYKTDNFAVVPTALTTVFRTQYTGDVSATGVFEMDLHVNGIRDQLIVYADNRIKLTRSGQEVDLTGTLDVTQWNVFRMTVDATAGTEGTVNIYLNEDPTPVLSATSTQATTSSYLRFGDGQSSVTYSANIDFITWETAGAYSPSEQAVPNGLIPEVNNWIVYTADLAPADNVDPNWNASNGSEGTWTAMADPDAQGNSIVMHESLGAGSGMYKTDNFPSVPLAMTTVFRTQYTGDVSATGVFEMDLHVNGIRDQLIIYADNRIKLTRSGQEIDLSGTLDVTEWNVFRMTVDATAGTEGTVNIYLNEDPTPVLTATSTQATTSSYLRFGDGQSSVTYSANIDFITWDLTGAYAPDEVAVPDGLIPEVTIPVGDWVTYTADFAPADNVDPNWNASNGSEGTWTSMVDPDVTGNSIVKHESLGAGSGMYKTDNFAVVPTALTTVFRTKYTGDALATGVFEMDLHVGGIRDQLIIYADNRIKLTRSGQEVDLSGTLNVNNWNVFRMTVDATATTEATVNIYLNEDPTPVLTATSTQATTSNYLRFGDGQSSVTYSSYIDFISWDGSGAYAPDETALPEGLNPTPDVGDWAIYTADFAPADNVDPNWNASNGSEGTWTVSADPDVDGNNIVMHESLGAGSGMYKTDNFAVVPTALTTVFRTKYTGDAQATGVFEMDLHVGGIRDQLIIYSDNRLKLTRSGVEVDLTGTLDVTQWNAFRMTVDATATTEATVNIYLNEDPTPVLTAISTQATTSNYLRFGDGQSSVTYSSYIDFIAWDVNGAYNPQQRSLPPGLIPGTETVETDAANLADLSIDNVPIDNFAGANTEYNIVLPYGTVQIPVVTANALYPGTTTVNITQASALPGAATVQVDANDGSSNTYVINFTIAPNTDASITAIQVDGTDILGFDPLVFDYEYRVPVGSSSIPVLTVSTTDPNATYAVNNAGQIPGTSTITITAEDNSTTLTYTVKFVFDVSDDATLSDLQIGGATISGFDPGVFAYNHQLSDNNIPGIIPTTTHPNAIAYVNYPDALDGSNPVDATVVVTAEDGFTQLTYTISLTTTEIITGLDELPVLRIFPNPFVNDIQIQNLESDAVITIYNQTGKILMNRRISANESELDVSVLSSGLYHVKIETSDRVEIFKMIK